MTRIAHDENCESQTNILKMGNLTFYVGMSWACTLTVV